MIDKLNYEEIIKIENYNKKNYKDSIDKASSLIKRDEVYNILLETFLKINKEFKIKEYIVNEQLTNLITSNFYNTISYIEKTTNKDTSVKASDYLKYINKNMNNILENLIYSLLETKLKVIDNDEQFEKYLKIRINTIYKDFFNVVIHKLSNDLLPKIIKSFIELYNLKFDETFIYKKMDNSVFEYKNMLINKSSLMLNEELKQIYKLFKIKENQQSSNQGAKKIPFSDFDFSNDVFKADFDDEKLALEILGLKNNVTFNEVRKAYKQLAIKFHPDKNNSEYALEEMKKINNAYNLLKKIMNK